MLPLTLLPFVAYLGLTQEGALLVDRVQVAISPPRLPELSQAERAWIATHAPAYDGAVALLLYHGIGRGADGDGGFSISPERFAEQLATLRAAGMHPVTAREVAEAFAGERQLPPNAVMISFDDGRSDAMMFADPLLEQAGMKATMFVIAEAASDPGIYYVSWAELREYEATGRWDMESHSANSHALREVADGRSLPLLTSLGPGESRSEYELRVEDDLADASSVLERQFQSRPVAFAYPFGAYGGRYDDRVNDPGIGTLLRAAVASNYSLAFNQDDQKTWGLATCSDDPLSLRRLEVGDWSGRTLLARIASAAVRLGATTCP